jgi:protoheme IX farnesyltransferase
MKVQLALARGSWGLKLRSYWSLTKSLQTGLLLLTGLAGYVSVHGADLQPTRLLAVAGSLFLAISGSTVLNMWYDRDIDQRMPRTCWRPLPTKNVTPSEALVLGIVLAVSGIGWGLALDWLYGLVILAGVLCNVFAYTIWLKRRTAWSIVWGGIAGGMPVLAGRAFALGRLDWIGVLLAAAVLFWIPTHILTFNMRYYDDYCQANIPTIPSAYGFPFTRITIAISSILAAVTMVSAALGIGLTAGYLRLMAVISSGLLLLSLTSVLRPSERMNFGLFKYASLYMFSIMLMIVIETIG